MKDSQPFSEIIESVDLKMTDAPWPFAQNERARIDAHWQELANANATIWNGNVLIAQDVYLGDKKLVARFSLTDYASLMAWRDWGFPDEKVFNIFGMPALMTSDNVLVFAEMASHTMNGGKIFPPGGSLEMADVVEWGVVDVEGSMYRETLEETGFDLTSARAAERFVIMDQQRIAVMQKFSCAETFADLERVFKVHVDDKKELTRLVPVKSRRSISPAMPPYAQEIVRHVFKK
jgi:8-oxo-dGTP pyrophosphatase MutT (NUDIX family)